MLEPRKPEFDATAFLASAGPGRSIVQLSEKQSFFSQGEAADSVFYLQGGRAKLTVVSSNGNQATITLLAAGDFAGEGALTKGGALHLATASAITDCRVLKIEREEMLRVLHEEPALSDVFMRFLLARGMRIEADLVDQLFNSSEKRLARILLLMADLGKSEEAEELIPEVAEQTLAEMLGAPLPSVSFFMNRFRELGLIDYDGRIRVHKALLHALLHDRLPGDNTATPEIVQPES